MAKITSFTRNLDGQIVYTKTGQAAPRDYFVVGSTVYKTADNAVGRVRVGSYRQPKNLTKKAAEKIERARQTHAKKTYSYGQSRAAKTLSDLFKKQQQQLEKEAGIHAAE